MDSFQILYLAIPLLIVNTFFYFATRKDKKGFVKVVVDQTAVSLLLVFILAAFSVFFIGIIYILSII